MSVKQLKPYARRHRTQVTIDMREVDNHDRPQVRSDCRSELRPCPWVGCKFHLYLDVNPETGTIKLNFPDLEPWEMRNTCALDVAERGGITLEEVGMIMNLTRERIRQVEVRGLLKLKVNPIARETATGEPVAATPPDPEESQED